MCCGREIYKQEQREEGQFRLTRRQMLKAVGLSTSLVTLGGLTGCTSFILESSANYEGRNELQVLGMRVNKEYSRTALKRWIKVARIINGVERGSKEELQERIQQAQEATYYLLNHWKETGYAEAVDRMLQEEGNKPPYNIELTADAKEAMLQRLKDAYSPYELKRLKNNLPAVVSKRSVIEPILRDGGIEAYIKRLAESASSLPDSVKAQQCQEICIACLAAAIVLCELGVDCVAAAAAAAACCALACG